MTLNDKMTALRAPFPADDIRWRAGPTNADKTRAMALPYITARAVMDRLDQIIGPMSWADQYECWPDGAVKAGIGIRLDDGEWVWKFDAAGATGVEAPKGSVSGAFKRAAVKWGIARYLYSLPKSWASCEAHGQSVRLSETPTLPAWALPSSTTSTTSAHATRNRQPAKTTEPATDEADPSQADVYTLANQVLSAKVSAEQVRAILATANETGAWGTAYDTLEGLIPA